MNNDIARRALLQSAGVSAAAPLLSGPVSPHPAASSSPAARVPSANPLPRRFLGKLEVASIGLGVQNMARKYETTVPYRPAMVALIRRAFESGITFFDTAEAYGPHECERILGHGPH